MSRHFTKYQDAHAYAIYLARQLDREVGIEKGSKLYYRGDGGFDVIHLPKPENRYGHELRCQVVTPHDPLSTIDIAVLEQLDLTCEPLKKDT
jgi:hypothetical protein